MFAKNWIPTKVPAVKCCNQKRSICTRTNILWQNTIESDVVHFSGMSESECAHALAAATATAPAAITVTTDGQSVSLDKRVEHVYATNFTMEVPGFIGTQFAPIQPIFS